jgi:hypothetical protein
MSIINTRAYSPVTSTSHVSLIVTFSSPARAMYLIGDMTARTRLTPFSYSSSKVVRAVCSSEKSDIPYGGPRTAERLVNPLLSRTQPHYSGSSDHPRLRLYLTPLVRLYFLLESGLNNNRAPNRYMVRCPFMATAHLRSPRCLIIPCNGFVFRRLSCISVIRGPGHHWLVLCSATSAFTFLPRNNSQFACASNVSGPTIGYSRWNRSPEWLSLPHRFFETLKIIALAQEEWLRSAPFSVSGQLSQWTGWNCLIPRFPRLLRR